MSHVVQRSPFSFTAVIEYWNCWRTACNQAITNYYNQRIESNPEEEAQQYWNRLTHPQSGINVEQITDAMLSRLMQRLIEQGISKFAVDRFILELRRHTRSIRSAQLAQR
jgi:hypothetical protein